ncbi:MAG: hypothetical protein AAF799_44315 [Myxococcota bacterium]
MHRSNLLLSIVIVPLLGLGACDPATGEPIGLEADPSLHPIAHSDALVAEDDAMQAVPGVAMEVAVVGDDAVLEWEPIPGAVQYGVSRGSGPYFTPGPFGASGALSTFLGSVWAAGGETSFSFADAGAASGDDHRYYRVVGWDSNGVVMGYTTTTAMMVFDLVEGANNVGIPLLDASIDSGSAVLDALPDALWAGRWNASSQSWQAFNGTGPAPDFALDSGEAFAVCMGAAGRLHLTGVVPQPTGDLDLAIDVGRSFVAAPLRLTMEPGDFYLPAPGVPASEIFDALDFVHRLSEWDPATMSFVNYRDRPDDVDFQVEIGQALWLGATEPGVW